MQEKESPGRAMMRMGEEMAAAFQEGLSNPPEIDPEELEHVIQEAERMYQKRRSHKGDMRIYDFSDDFIEVDLQKNKIAAIQVAVVIGDEVVRVVYLDKPAEIFDAGSLLCNGRMLDDVDYIYTLTGDQIQEWLHFVPDENGDTISYQRARAFGATSLGVVPM